jgi:hypothetical protein
MIATTRRMPPARRIFLSDRQLQAITDAARPLPLTKRGLLWSSVMARLNLCTGPHVDDDDVTRAIESALCGLRQQLQRS